MKRIMINFVFVLCLIAGLGQGLALAQGEEPLAEDSQPVEPAKAKVDQASFEKWKNLNPEEREKLKKRYGLLKNMPVQERQALNENLKRFKNLPQEKQERLRRNWHRINNLSTEERQEFLKNHKKWQGLPPDKREILRHRYDKFSGMGPEEHQDFSKKQKRWQGMAEEEKRKLHKDYKMKREFPRRQPRQGKGRR